MSARLTVVLDDESLYREAKIRAVQDGVPLKEVITNALESYLRSDTSRPRKRLTLEMLDRWREESLRMDAEIPDDYPTDLSDVKHHLYGWAKQSERYAAEEPAKYDP